MITIVPIYFDHNHSDHNNFRIILTTSATRKTQTVTLGNNISTISGTTATTISTITTATTKEMTATVTVEAFAKALKATL